MHIFITGATGWVGSAVIRDLIGAGHRVTGLARDPAKAAALVAAGVDIRIGTLDDLALLREAASAADAVIHTAFNHDFSAYADHAAQDRRAIETLGAALAGSTRPLLATSGVAKLASGRLATENDRAPADPSFPRQSDAAVDALRGQGVRAATVRLAPSVHGRGDHGFIPMLIDLARRTGVSAYVGDGMNRWPGVHRDDAARLYRLAVEDGAGAAAYHAIADEGVPFRHIAEVIGRRLAVPVESRNSAHFGWLGMFAGADMAASSALTRSRVGWAPAGPDLLSDIDQPAYYEG